jgi:hypothetical protein
MVAFADCTNGRIVGATPGTLVYGHELGHLKFNQSDKGIKLFGYSHMILNFFFALLLATIFFRDNILFMITALLLLVYYLIEMYEEIWCWIYGFKYYYSDKIPRG